MHGSGREQHGWCAMQRLQGCMLGCVLRHFCRVCWRGMRGDCREQHGCCAMHRLQGCKLGRALLHCC